MTEGAGLRQSHFGSGYDAGKARLQAEVEQLKEQIAAQTAVVAEVRARLWPERDFVSHFSELCEHQIAVNDALGILNRLDAADVPADKEHPAVEGWRQLLWSHHGHSGLALYGDDGELQCHACPLDFKRASYVRIQEVLLINAAKDVPAASTGRAECNCGGAFTNGFRDGKYVPDGSGEHSRYCASHGDSEYLNRSKPAASTGEVER